ncbi:YtxH domain-containing protein [Clostridium sp.]|uniref:YtxH domain-containing protein n=1 Tax=Clostridium sp. TaxID=1506 RepID=UPI00262A4ED3|nr:YtxH domain-containing protein [Clostridium sp.]
MLFLGKVIKSLAIGTVLGMAIGMMVLPELDRKTQRNIRRTSKKLRCAAGDAYDNLLDYMN